MSERPLSTAAVATVGGTAARRIPGLVPLGPAMSVCGPAATCRCAPGDNLSLHRLLATAPSGSVLVCAAEGDGDHAYAGELMALDARNRGLAGIVVDGAVRDAVALLEIGLAVFHGGLTPTPCVKADAPSVGEPVEVRGVRVAPGDMVIADGDAVLVVARAEWPELATRARALEAEEDGLRAALARGERLADLLVLDLGVVGS